MKNRNRKSMAKWIYGRANHWSDGDDKNWKLCYFPYHTYSVRVDLKGGKYIVYNDDVDNLVEWKFPSLTQAKRAAFRLVNGRVSNCELPRKDDSD